MNALKDGRKLNFDAAAGILDGFASGGVAEKLEFLLRKHNIIILIKN